MELTDDEIIAEIRHALGSGTIEQQTRFAIGMIEAAADHCARYLPAELVASALFSVALCASYEQLGPDETARRFDGAAESCRKYRDFRSN